MDNSEAVVKQLEDEMNESFTRFFVPLQTTRVIQEGAFEEFYGKIAELAKVLKEKDCVPKSVLKTIYASIRIMENESGYFKDDAPLLTKLADRLEFLFHLILIGESLEDRVPGAAKIL